MSKDSKTIVVTGASKGIGLAIAKQEAAKGHTVIGLARNASEDFSGTFYEVDLGDAKATQKIAEKILKKHGRVDHLVNNVGLVRPAKIGTIDLQDFDDVMNVNLKPAIILTQAFLPNMKDKAYGRIVNISSLAVLGLTDRTAYSAAKAALVSFTRSWALELALDGITANSVAPGPTETELFRENSPPGSEGEKSFLSKVPMNRFAKPEEIASAVGFLLSENAGIITGQTLYVDGGASIGKNLL